MNKKQKIVFLVGLGIIILMGLFPPWYIYHPYGSRPGEYAFIFSGSSSSDGTGVYIDIVRLLIQWVVVAIATAGIMLVLKDDTRSSEK